jgi:uncharacterized membrane protein
MWQGRTFGALCHATGMCAATRIAGAGAVLSTAYIPASGGVDLSTWSTAATFLSRQASDSASGGIFLGKGLHQLIEGRGLIIDQILKTRHQRRMPKALIGQQGIELFDGAL